MFSDGFFILHEANVLTQAIGKMTDDAKFQCESTIDIVLNCHVLLKYNRYQLSSILL